MRATLIRMMQAGLMFMIVTWAKAEPLGTAFTYQGRLDHDGVPADGDYQIRFQLFDRAEGGTTLGSWPTADPVPPLPVKGGLFTTALDFGINVFSGEARFVQISVRRYTPAEPSGPLTPLSPRQVLRPTPYALYATKSASALSAQTAAAVPWTGITGLPAGFTDAVDDDHVYGNGPGVVLTPTARGGTFSLDTAFTDARYENRFWKLGGNGGTTPAQFLGTTDSQALDLRVNNERGLRLEPKGTHGPNLIGGSYSNAVVAGAAGATIGGGGRFFQLGGATINEANRISDNYGSIAGGALNTAGNANGTPEDAAYASVGGGYANQARAQQSTIAGGRGNRALALNSAIGGGLLNQSTAEGATIAGGLSNTNETYASVIGGGQLNFVGTNVYDGGGFFVTNYGIASAVLGGQNNRVSSYLSGVGTGAGNGVYGHYGFIGGGLANRIGSPGLPADELSGGTVAGGLRNQVWAGGATVGGGELNEAAALWSTVPGGVFNVAAGRYAFAAGRRAKANHDGTFVWADATDADYATTAPNQFRVRASGGAFFEGTLTTKVLTITGGADLAEPFPISDQNTPAGALVAIDETNPGRLRMCERAYDTRVAGVLSGANGINPGIMLYQQGALEGSRNVALTGRVYALADASSAAIKPGDLLTSSDTPGHAMKVGDSTRANGAIIGKAMTGLKEGKGMVLVLISLQ